MIYFSFNLSIPFFNRFDLLDEIDKPITKNKSFTLSWYKTSSIIGLTFNFNPYQDHGGLDLIFELFGYGVEIEIRDNRHWDYENKKWCVYELGMK